MRKNLLEFLFGPNAIQESNKSLGEDVIKLFEEAADEEIEQMTANKKPLAAALKSIGITATVTEGPQCCEIRCDNEADYREYCQLLGNADSMHKLAELGWVTAHGGDAGQSFEAPDFKIGFIELKTTETGSDKEKPEDLEKVLKTAQAAVAEPIDRDDDELNPVENGSKSAGGKGGIGKAQDGAKPEGKPKGVSEARRIASQMLDEMTSVSAIPALEGPPIGIVGKAATARSRFQRNKGKNDKRAPAR